MLRVLGESIQPDIVVSASSSNQMSDTQAMIDRMLELRRQATRQPSYSPDHDRQAFLTELYEHTVDVAGDRGISRPLIRRANSPGRSCPQEVCGKSSERRRVRDLSPEGAERDNAFGGFANYVDDSESDVGARRTSAHKRSRAEDHTGGSARKRVSVHDDDNDTRRPSGKLIVGEVDVERLLRRARDNDRQNSENLRRQVDVPNKLHLLSDVVRSSLTKVSVLTTNKTNEHSDTEAAARSSRKKARRH